MLPLGREAALKTASAIANVELQRPFAAAAHPSGSKLPRHSHHFLRYKRQLGTPSAINPNTPPSNHSTSS
ncbi:hypothetical protein C1Y08_03005 [Pseudomonas sp. FW306-02-F02-AA]|nr:hypothetical protein C1Y07_01590 [Pseudomonas sp. FW306-02-F02-AB]PMZ11271.1 hypothetical protein C1Y06_03320 [Pseudomonas sp. FW306-02-H06C]PMZ17194.1 hypothetical protein C1Y08_03005 [Pseudomonas sp. FW306-02-F02-AA]PMZ22911.1 hypothetical protein C1Y09_04665 [Pseudomonas sp. FW306-02-F08-AA]PMZ28740.1 hypothetical protein C1Y05_05070 [Pseudomonas sp. FW306-02-F04-BA]PMZ36073.1 hypothetical protein C1X99_01710 [Pseudomonas sp. FW306-02-H06B]PMZ41409.1 hypothetical protein C1Y00_05530 [Ps